MDIKSVNMDSLVRVSKAIAISSLVLFIVILVTIVFGGASGSFRYGMHNRYWQDDETTLYPGSSIPMMRSGYDNSFSGPVAEDNIIGGDTSFSNGSDSAKIAKTGSLDLRVTDVNTAVQNLRDVASKFNGEIFSSSVYDRGVMMESSLSKSAVVTMRVPSDQFDSAMQEIKKIANVVINESTNSYDETSAYTDLQARLKNKQAEEAAIADILNRDTNKIDDVLQVTVELSRVRGEIEEIEAQIRYLNSQTDKSLITVSLTEDAQVGKTDTAWRPSQEVKNAVNALIRVGQGIVNFLISFAIVIVPVLLLALLVLGGLLYFVAKKLYQMLNR